MMEHREAKELLRKYSLGTITDREKEVLDSWYNNEAKSRKSVFISDRQMEQDLEKISGGLPVGKDPIGRAYSSRFIRMSVAASLLTALSFSVYIYFSNERTANPVVSAFVNDVAPGKTKAILTLADNRQVLLDESTEGDVARQTGIAVTKLTDGRLRYVVSDVGAAASNQFNTISTPRGGEYQVELSDGTVVWLNSNSSVRFPVSFSSGTRRIQVSGEVYLEVARNAQKPFLVESKGQVIEVLGTHFNINAYDEKQVVKTTLLEGSVKVSLKGNTASKILRPGEQSITGSSHMIELKKIDTEGVIAWKNGYFLFNDDELANIMTELSQWYDVEVDYQSPGLRNQKFSGSISRSKSLRQVLRVLELTGNIKCKLEGRRITVMP